MVNGRKFGLVFAATVLAFACGGGPIEEMVHIPPQQGYEAQLAGFREQRDVYFATDPDSPLLPDERPVFSGLEYFEPQRSLYFVGDLQVYIDPEHVQMVTTAGQFREAQRTGFVAFRIEDKPYRLQVYRLTDGSGGLFLPFQDTTSGDETYAAGRYVVLISSSENGPYELDFNRAYNPSCAYGEAERFACPVTPAENRLDVRIAAGERGRADVATEGGR